MKADNFDDIRPWNDAELLQILDEVLTDRDFLANLVGLRFASLRPRRWRWLKRLLVPLVARVMRHQLREVKTISQFQLELKKYIRQLIAESCSAFSWSGLNKLPDRPHLYVSNHRDIIMDTVFVNYALHLIGRDTVRIAVGDNLLQHKTVANLLRINKCFVVRRAFDGPRDEIIWRKRFSRYIRKSLLVDKQSVWIAQRDGRAKDGNDSTHPGLIRMLLMAGDRELKGAGLLRALSIVPVAISYEYDPCDVRKARELVALETQGNYIKDSAEDLSSIVTGSLGYKGRVHLSFGQPLHPETDDRTAVAGEIDRQIYADYLMQPCNYLACRELGKEVTQGFCGAVGQPYEADRYPANSLEFEKRIAAVPELLRTKILEMYANPLLNQQSL